MSAAGPTDRSFAHTRRELLQACAAAGAMGTFALLAKGLTPTLRATPGQDSFRLDAAVPEVLGDWSWDRSVGAAVVEPQQAQLLRRLYAQTLARVYTDTQGRSVMLSIAYGQDQRDGLQLHYPEVCYPAQGFEVLGREDVDLVWGERRIAARRVRTALARQRFEPLTYWTTVGGEVVRGGVSKKLAEMRHGLRGEVPDGLLVRVSSIDMYPQRAFEVQASFARAFLQHLSPSDQRRFAGA